MQNRFLPVLLALLAGLLSPVAGATGACERLVATGDPEQPPYLWLDPQTPGQMIGASADLLELLAKTLDLKIDLIRSGSRPAAEQHVASGRIDLLLGSFPGGARRESLDFIEPALFVQSVVAWVRRERVFPYGGWSDLYAHQGVIQAGDRFTRGFDPLSATSLPLKEAPTLNEALRMLRRGEVAYLLGERQVVQAAAESLGMLAEVQPLPPLLSEGLYLAVGRDSACNTPELRARLAAGLTELNAAGLAGNLLQRNAARWLAQGLPSPSVVK
ncbi:extracellular solute-binding protein [Azotobacter vinelandii CA]|uniref:Bacterial extracellular solute-binding protein, family 3 n=2 Tax=Azotobacter vinelandii TaxID=354 RepID=C1DRJ7_AZOVD|nr:transporter substrate-binding domain-containing protein [Azotobacter vinelandii]ACO77735.1 Bacterial extracellular solute-binding protein, family 3 [Azotobacter vinelandii DJ]AGK15300.1 extracellular solute-binding protein [Azotobacter vinelandii CA]AGK19944.1 extracellular solute-binding protein [Azotobacter vinelandii CA6]WKN23492.1 transporter substrate-binding domain-containing protein [Azotobacter vinelandii]SFX97653.1 amino acid ABC transporter substrate-binding protein, PAAT family [